MLTILIGGGITVKNMQCPDICVTSIEQSWQPSIINTAHGVDRKVLDVPNKFTITKIVKSLPKGCLVGFPYHLVIIED